MLSISFFAVCYFYFFFKSFIKKIRRAGKQISSLVIEVLDNK